MSGPNPYGFGRNGSDPSTIDPQALNEDGYNPGGATLGTAAASGLRSAFGAAVTRGLLGWMTGLITERRDHSWGGLFKTGLAAFFGGAAENVAKDNKVTGWDSLKIGAMSAGTVELLSGGEPGFMGTLLAVAMPFLLPALTNMAGGLYDRVKEGANNLGQHAVPRQPAY